MKKFFSIFILILALSCQPSASSRINMQSFEAVWQTVNENHYDPTFGGLDWQEIHDKYQTRLTGVNDDEKFRDLLNEMLFELGLSHLLVASNTELKMFLPDLFAEGGIGIDIALIEDMPVISSVKASSPGAQAGLRKGFIVKDIDGSSAEQLLSEGEENLVPPFNERNRRNNMTRSLLAHLYGSPGTTVSVGYLDEKGKRYEKRIIRVRRGKGRIFSEAMPPFFIEFEARKLENKIGYIRFNHFADPVDKDFALALESMQDAPAIIVDLRSTSGGFLRTMDEMARHLLKSEALFYTFKMRNRTVKKVLSPAENSYTRPVVLIINEKSMSCSEIFAGSLKALGRAVVVGERSPGYSLIADWKRLPNGDAFMYIIGQNRTPDGLVLEDQGVVPDLYVNLDQRKLLEGIDTQLQAAVQHLQTIQ